MQNSNRITRFFVHPTTLAVIILTALWVIFFWRLWTPNAEDRVIFQKGDFPLHYFAYSDYQVERMFDGEIPLWNPYNYGGDPFAANVQWAVWYPPRWIAALVTGLVAGPDGWSIEALQFEVAAHYWLVSLMMYAFLRVLFDRARQVPLVVVSAGRSTRQNVSNGEGDWGGEAPQGWKKVITAFPALLGSILWTYGGYLTGYPMLQSSILESIAWLPLMLLGAHLSITDSRWRVRGILLAGAMMAISFFGGHTQTTLQMAYFTAAYLTYFGWKNGFRWRGIAGRIALFGITGAALAAVQLIPAVELTRLSYRAETYHYAEKATGYTTPELAQFIWPHLFSAEYWPLYLGVAGFLFAVAAILRDPRRHAFWLGTILVALLLAMGGYSMVYDVFYLFAPGFSIFREQERAASLAVFALVILATDQIASLFARHDQSDSPSLDLGGEWLLKLAHAHLILTGLVFLTFTVILNVTHDHAISPDLAHAVGVVALVSLIFNGWLFWFRRERHTLIPAALLLIIVVDLFSFGMNSPNFVEDNAFNRIPPPENLALLQQSSEDIAWHVDGAAGIQSYGTYWRIPDVFGTGPFRLSSLEKLRQIRVDRRWEVLAVRYATMTAEVPANVPVRVVGEGVNFDGLDYTLYELTDPRPFAHLVYTAQDFENSDAARQFMIEEPHIDLREIALVADSLPFELPGTRPADAAQNTVLAFNMTMPEYVEMAVSTEANALLTVAVANYPGWQAQVNGQDVDIVDTYGGLIGIPIPAGANQKVTLQFLPQTIIIGAIISVLALIAVVGLVIGDALRSRGRARES